MRHIIMWFYFHLLLKFLIKRNYRLRQKSALLGNAKYPDVWYWADEIAVKHGFFVEN